MDRNVRFLTKLQRVAQAGGSAHVRAMRAAALFDSYRAQIYRQLEMDAPRPTTSAKLVADCALNHLRQRILKAEVGTTGPAKLTLMTVRHRIDMSRRVLALRVARDDTLPIVGAYEWSDCTLLCPKSSNGH
jgi:hypothetical protein